MGAQSQVQNSPNMQSSQGKNGGQDFGNILSNFNNQGNNSQVDAYNNNNAQTLNAVNNQGNMGLPNDPNASLGQDMTNKTYSPISGQPTMGQPNPYPNTVGMGDNSINTPTSGKGFSTGSPGALGKGV